VERTLIATYFEKKKKSKKKQSKKRRATGERIKKKNPSQGAFTGRIDDLKRGRGRIPDEEGGEKRLSGKWNITRGKVKKSVS